VNDGTVKAYGVTSRTRVPTLPNLPTLDESALKDLQVGVWHGVYAPKGTPNAAVDKLSAAIQESLKEPALRERMAPRRDRLHARTGHTGRADRAPEGRDRPLVADHQGSGRLRRLSMRVRTAPRAAARSRTTGLGLSGRPGR
jgi:hypothetical protein